MRTDDFPLDVIRRLRERVAHRCSNPQCRVVTIGAGSNPIGVNSIGQAAHISGAASGAARFQASMSFADRKAIDNGIWLCASCHAKIDRDEQRYTVDLLRCWKDEAEEVARSELGQRPLSNAECQGLMISALSGVPKNHTRTALANLIEASGQELRRLDSRFRVITSYANETFTHAIHAVEEVHLSFKVTSEPGSDTVEEMRRMFDHGTPVTISAERVSVEGSPLVTHILDLTTAHEGTLTFTPRQLSATLKLVLSNPRSQQVSAFEDMQGTIQIGRRSMNFAGSNCAGLLNISFRKEFNDDQALIDGQFWADLTQWDGSDVRRLPYHDKVSDLFDKLAADWQLEFSLEVEGRELLRGRFNDTQALRPYVSAVDVLLRYSKRVRALAKHLSLRIDFHSDTSFTSAEHKAAADALDIFDGHRIYEREDLKSNVKCRLVVNNEVSAKLLKRTTPMEVMIRSDNRESVKLFDQNVMLPALEILLEAVTANVLSQSAISEGNRKLRVEFIPVEGYRCIFRYADSTSSLIYNSALDPM